MRAEHQPTLEVFTHTVQGRLNEDAWLAMQSGPLGDTLVIAAIDGATTRLTPPPLQRYLDGRPGPLTPAAFAARFARDSLARQVGTGLPPELRTLVLEANADLGRALIGLFGALTLEGMKFPDEVYATLKDDPRLVRLGLPAAVVTLAEYVPADHSLRWIHAGDTLLMVGYHDGRVVVPTLAESGEFDGGLKRTALAMRQYHPDRSFRELTHEPEVVRYNLHAGLRHNFVDEHGLPQPAQGIGAIDGLPELRYFLRGGMLSLDGAAFVCVMTDGLEWPAPAEEVFAEDPAKAADLGQQRRAFIGEQIARHGLAGYVRRLRQAEAADPDHEQYPRMKTHDDATGVLLRFTGE